MSAWWAPTSMTASHSLAAAASASKSEKPSENVSRLHTKV
eukprot:CAMPEP_0204564120 /NCGR_PEP_ID=MMETSP0661-20131031/34704_1 /ASSEMBLY_ACC=CAM_ASM_000606 /TAXON_ID=109239 /ORGANISM="Alexandrium margalefi, Strain AMGDE01CS-322" /LENGTH=39 /DNA_ID= /DNA_START= /DNA_END= /DNA_ORIENTATION=